MQVLAYFAAWEEKYLYKCESRNTAINMETIHFNQ